jgi:hypothetical protein
MRSCASQFHGGLSLRCYYFRKEARAVAKSAQFTKAHTLLEPEAANLRPRRIFSINRLQFFARLKAHSLAGRN